MEAQIAFPTLLQAIRTHNLVDDVVCYNPTATLRAPSELWLER